MDRKQKGTFWSILGVSTVYIATNFWLATQGGDVALPAPIKIDTAAHAAAVYGLWILLPMVFLLLYVSQEVIDTVCVRRVDRLPDPFGIPLDRNQNLDRRLLIGLVSLVLIVPIAAVVHLENKMLKGTVIVSPSRMVKLSGEGSVPFDQHMCQVVSVDYGCIVASNWKTHLFDATSLPALLSGNYENAFQFDPIGCGEKEGPCKGLTFFPFLEPWLLFLGGLCSFGYWLRLVWLLIRSTPTKVAANE